MKFCHCLIILTDLAATPSPTKPSEYNGNKHSKKT